MNHFSTYELAKLRIAERHAEAARERLVREAHASSSDGEHEDHVWRRWTLRRLVGRITLAQAGG